MVGYAGLLLRAAREQAGIKLHEMAEATGHHHRDLSRIERGTRGWHVTPDVVKIYEELLEMPLAEAVERLTSAAVTARPVPGPALRCPLATPAAWEPVAEPLSRLLEALSVLTAQIAALLPTTPDPYHHQHVNGKVRISE